MKYDYHKDLREEQAGCEGQFLVDGGHFDELYYAGLFGVEEYRQGFLPYKRAPANADGHSVEPLV